MPNMATVLTNSNGSQIVDANGDFTLGRACITALDSALMEDREESLLQKLKRGKVIEEIELALAGDGDLSLTAEDVSMLKTRINKTFTAASIVRKLCKLLDPAVE